MSTVAATAAMPPLPGIAHEVVTPRTAPVVGGAGTAGDTRSIRVKVANWMESHLGKAAMPVAALAGGALLGTVGFLTLGPVGAAVGGAAGAFTGALLFMAG